MIWSSVVSLVHRVLFTVLYAEPSAPTLQLAITHYAKNGDKENTIKYFELMEKWALEPNQETLNAMLEGFKKSKLDTGKMLQFIRQVNIKHALQ